MLYFLLHYIYLTALVTLKIKIRTKHERIKYIALLQIKLPNSTYTTAIYTLMHQ